MHKKAYIEKFHSYGISKKANSIVQKIMSFYYWEVGMGSNYNLSQVFFLGLWKCSKIRL